MKPKNDFVQGFKKGYKEAMEDVIAYADVWIDYYLARDRDWETKI